MVGEGEEGPRVGGSGPLSFKYRGCRTQTRPLESPLKEARLGSSLLCHTRNTTAGDPGPEISRSGNVGFLPLPEWLQPARDRRDTSLDRDGHTSEARGQGGMLPRSSPWLMDTFACLGCLRHLVVTTLLSWVSFPQEAPRQLSLLNSGLWLCPLRTAFHKGRHILGQGFPSDSVTVIALLLVPC